MKYDNSGILGKNERKEKETHPSYTGQCTIEGQAYWISGWVKEGERGRFFSLSFKRKDQPNAAQKNKPKKEEEDFDDNLPF